MSNLPALFPSIKIRSRRKTRVKYKDISNEIPITNWIYEANEKINISQEYFVKTRLYAKPCQGMVYLYPHEIVTEKLGLKYLPVED